MIECGARDDSGIAASGGQSLSALPDFPQGYKGAFCEEGKDVGYEGDEEKISDRLYVLPAMVDRFCVLYAFSNWVHDL